MWAFLYDWVFICIGVQCGFWLGRWQKREANKVPVMSTLEEREIYLNCKQAKCWASVNIKELMAEKAELEAERKKLTDAIENAIQNLESEESRLKNFDVVALHLLRASLKTLPEKPKPENSHE